MTPDPANDFRGHSSTGARSHPAPGTCIPHRNQRGNPR